MADAHKNFAYSTLTNSPGTGGTTFSVADASQFPTIFPFNATVWPSASQPTSTTAEIVTVTGVAANDFSVTRAQESTTARNVANGWQMAATITAKTLTDIENNYVNSWSPYIPTSAGFATQTIASASGMSSTGSLFVFPITAQFPIKFNQIIIPVAYAMVSSAVLATSVANNTYYSKFGLYSMMTGSNNTVLTLITSNSFSIGDTMNSNSLTWVFPTTTATSAAPNGYGYGPLSICTATSISSAASNWSTYLSNATLMSSYITGSRAVGLQFATEMSISGGQYWLALLHQRSTSGSSVWGLSNAGIIGQAINTLNQAGLAVGPMPIGVAPAEWAQKNTHISGWFGRQLIGFVSNTTLPNFWGSCIPNNISLIHLGGTGASAGTILPTVTFCST